MNREFPMGAGVGREGMKGPAKGGAGGAVWEKRRGWMSREDNER